jgi:hypothetical protein
MKNKLYYLGLASIIIITTGAIFKIMHWPTAGIMLTVGMTILIFAFLPSALISSFKSENIKKYKLLYILIGIVFMIDLAAALFKIMHWPGAGIMILIGTPLPFIIVLPAYLLTVGKETEINYRNFLAILFFFAYFAAISALLSLGVSKGLIDHYINSAITIEQRTNQINQQCKEKYLTMSKTSIDSLKSESIKNIVNKSDELCHDIDNLTREMLGYPARESQLSTASFIWDIEFKDGGISPEITSSAIKVKSGLDELKALLKKVAPDKNPSVLIARFAIENDKGPEFYKQNLVKDKIVVSAIERLNLIKHQVRLAELQVLTD